MLDEFQEMICFAAVAEKGSVTAAADALGRSKAHISRKIVELESRLKTKLLHRSTRRLTLTDSGNRLREEALQLYKSGQLLAMRAESLDDQPRGKFSITASHSVMSFLVGPFVKELQDTFSEVTFRFITSNAPFDLVAEGIDMGIRTGGVVDERLIAHEVGVQYDKFFYCPKTYSPSPAVNEVADLLSHRLLINTLSQTGGMLQLSNGTDVIRHEPRTYTAVSDQPFLINLVLQGCGIGLASDYRIRELGATGDAELILSDWWAKRWPVYIVYPFLAPLPTKLTRISAFFRERISQKLSNLGSAPPDAKLR